MKKVFFVFFLGVVMNMSANEIVSIRKSEDRGSQDLGWLSTQYSFSFSEYYDPNHMGFRALRVINEDVIEPGKGFDTHPHDNMEILTLMIAGTIEHKDTMGNLSQIKQGEIQLMSAGTGIKHSEFNPSKNEKNHLLQIWIYPEKKGLKPMYQQRDFSKHEQGLCLIAAPDGKENSLVIHQDAEIYLGRFSEAEKLTVSLKPKRHLWVQMVHGEAQFDGTRLEAGDGAGISGKKEIVIQAKSGSEFLLFDLK